MKRLVLAIIALLAIFVAVRAYTQNQESTGMNLSPGLVQVSGGPGSLSLAFGLMGGGESGGWNVLPLRIMYTEGDRTVSLSLNGLSFLVAGGVKVGRPVAVDRPTTGDIVSVGGKVTVDNAVTGDVWAFGADIVLSARADVGGSVVAVGGKVSTDPHARVAGGIHSLPQLKLPYLGILSTQAAAPALQLARELLVFLLAVVALLLYAYFLGPQMAGASHAISEEWRRSIAIAVIGLILLPVTAVLLVVSVFGIFLLPFLFLSIVAFGVTGYLSLAARFGSLLRRGTGESTLFVFTSGLLGLFIFRLPVLAGMALAIVKSQVAGAVGLILRLVGMGLTIALFAYGFGCALASARKASAPQG